jgi:hypothetical protein
MAKSRADIQRAYRERKKKELGQEYFDKEKKRVKEYYIPTKELSKKDHDARNLMKKEGMRRSRDKKKKEKVESLVVKMSFSAGKSIGGKTRVRNTIKEQRQEIRKLSNENEKITNKYKPSLRKYREKHMQKGNACSQMRKQIYRKPFQKHLEVKPNLILFKQE